MERDYRGFTPRCGKMTYIPSSCGDFMIKIYDGFTIHFQEFRPYSIRVSSFVGLQVSDGCLNF